MPRVHSFKKAPDAQDSKLLVFIGVNSDAGDKRHRNYLRNSWVPGKDELKRLEKETGVMIRFIVGKRCLPNWIFHY